jgi:hypothetical protein
MQDDGDEERDLSYLNHPFLNPADYLKAMAFLGFAPGRPRAGERLARPNLTPVERLFLPSGKYTRTDVEVAKSLAFWWEDYGFSCDQVRAWLHGGLAPREAGLAALLVEEGITPERLYEPCRHRTTKELLPLIDVARLLPQSRAYAPDATLCDLLDEWSVPRERRRGPIVPNAAKPIRRSA